MLADITEYYHLETKSNTYKHIKEYIYIGTCDFELCGLPILEGKEFTHKGKIYCSKYHKDEQIQIEKDGE